MKLLAEGLTQGKHSVKVINIVIIIIITITLLSMI